MEKATCRGAFSEKILQEAKKDKDIIVVCTDSRGSASLGSYPEELPEQFVEMGIAEQNSVTVSAGMAAMGKKVYAIGPASFYSMRSAEQVKVDVAYSHNNVKIIGISGGISYGALGATHHSLQDIALMRAVPDLIVEIPSDANQMKGLVDAFLKDETPAYVRIGRGAVPVIYPEDVKVEIGKAVKWGDGKDVGIIACGQMVYRALDAAKLLEEQGIHATVLDMHTIKPLDEAAVLSLASECGCILTVEEHSIYGGLGGAVAEVLAANKPVPMTIAGIPDADVPNGGDAEVFTLLGLDAAGICEKAKALLERK
ncbi:MAG: transketolase C-terminal domain-containing protein [Eubacteriales bacterium]|nr:transketolase C-terminal domain-containing protein [Eubacteriales bacterium]